MILKDQKLSEGRINKEWKKQTIASKISTYKDDEAHIEIWIP